MLRTLCIVAVVALLGGCASQRISHSVGSAQSPRGFQAVPQTTYSASTTRPYAPPPPPRGTRVPSRAAVRACPPPPPPPAIRALPPGARFVSRPNGVRAPAVATPVPRPAPAERRCDGGSCDVPPPVPAPKPSWAPSSGGCDPDGKT